MYYNHRYQEGIIDIYKMLSGYIRANNGSFPLSQKDLTNKGFLREREENGDIIYEFRQVLNTEENWRELYPFEEYIICYGFDPNDSEIHNEKLCSKEKHTPVLLISGPYKWPLISQYEKYSIKLYKEMINEQ